MTVTDQPTPSAMPRRRTKRFAAAVSLVALALAACSAPTPPGAAGGADGPINLQIVDVGGVLAFTQPMIDEYVAANPDKIAQVTYEKAPSTELAGKLEAQQGANDLRIDLVLSGSDAIGAGIVKNLWDPISGQESALPGLAGYTEDARKIYAANNGAAMVVATEFTGPLIEYNPAAVVDPPSNAEELLAYAQANPGRFTYAQPPRSGPGRQFLMGLPYLLGDSDPSDPEKGWDKTWAYLAELDKYVGESYPSGTGATFESLAKGGVDMIASTAGWDVGQRQQGAIPMDIKIGTLEGFNWIVAGHFAALPKGLPTERRDVVLGLLDHMLTKPAQTSMYAAQEKIMPGPAVDGVTVQDAPADVQQKIAEFDRPEYAALFENAPTAVELAPDRLSVMFDRWEREIGS